MSGWFHFYDTFLRFADDNNLMLTDLHRLKDVFTFCNDAGNAFSWIDYFLCSHAVDSLVSDCSVHCQYVTSDHKPISVTYNHLLQHDNASASITNDVVTNCKVLLDWSKCDAHCIGSYQYELDLALARINIPKYVA